MKIKEALAAAILLLLPTMVMAEDLIRIGLFNKDAAIIAADEKGFLKNETLYWRTYWCKSQISRIGEWTYQRLGLLLTAAAMAQSPAIM